MNNATIIANMRRAARDNQSTTIGGGVFGPEELRIAADALEASDRMLEAAIEFMDGEGNCKNTRDMFRAAIAKARGQS